MHIFVDSEGLLHMKLRRLFE